MKKSCLVILLISLIALPALAQEPPKPPQPSAPPQPQPQAKELTRDELLQKDIEEAVKKLSSNNFRENDEARQELIEIGKKATPYLIKALDSDKPEVRLMVCEILGHIRDSASTDALIKRLSDLDKYGRSIASAAAKTLGLIGDEKAIPELVKLLDSDNAKVDVELRYEIVTALGIFRAKEAEGPLKKLLEDKAPLTYLGKMVAIASIDALGKIHAKGAIPDIAKLLSDKTKEEWSGRTMAMAAAGALQKITGIDNGPIIEDGEEKTKTTIQNWVMWWDNERKKEAQTKIDATMSTMKIIDEALEKFKLNENRYPDKLIDFVTKPPYATKWLEGGYLKEVPKDGWGHDFVYQTIGAKGESYGLFSYGADGKEGGTGPDAEIRWETTEQFGFRIKDTQTSMKMIAEALEKFKEVEGRYPEKLIDLVIKPPYAKAWKEPYLKTKDLLKDTWGNNFIYKVPSATAGEPFDLISFGVDGKEGGIGRDTDIKWQKEKK